jgi:hypothetical protein
MALFNLAVCNDRYFLCLVGHRGLNCVLNISPVFCFQEQEAATLSWCYSPDRADDTEARNLRGRHCNVPEPLLHC